jgi:hypothetical protein
MNRAVSGSTCISPTARWLERESGTKPLSVLMTAAISAGSRSLRAASARIASS